MLKYNTDNPTSHLSIEEALHIMEDTDPNAIVINSDDQVLHIYNRTVDEVFYVYSYHDGTVMFDAEPVPCYKVSE